MPKKCRGLCTLDPLERRLLLDAVPVGPEFRVNTYTTSGQRSPSIAMAANGDFIIAWNSFGQDGLTWDVFAQRYNAAGALQGDEFRVNTYTTNDQWAPSIAMDDDGDFVVAWERQVGPFGEVYAQRYNSEGVPQGGEFRVNTSTTGDYPSIAMDDDGDFVIAWTSYGQDGSGYGIFAQRYNAAGAPQGGELRVNTYTISDQSFPSVAIDADGDFIVVWQSSGQDGSISGVYAQRYNAAGVPQGGDFRVNTYTTNGQSNPSIAMDDDGNFVATWTSRNQDGSSDGIYAQRYDSEGVPQGSEFRVNTYTTSFQGYPSISMDTDGDFVVAWQSLHQDGSWYGIYAQCYSAAGLPQGGEFRVNSYTADRQRLACVAMGAAGDFVVVWESNGQDGSGYGIYAQRYAVAPAINLSSFEYLAAPHSLEFTFTQDVSASLGTDDLQLENLTTGQIIPASDISLGYDTSTNTATFAYTGVASGIVGVLPDGNYRATLLAAGITNTGGIPLAADHLFDFFFLNGDANRDARVNLEDFNILASNFGQTARDFTQGDFTYDGIVNLADFNILASRFGSVLASPSFRANPANAHFSNDLVEDEIDGVSELLS